MNPTRIPAGYRISTIGGVPELVPDPGPRFRNGQRVQPRAPQPTAQPAAPAQRRPPTIEERLARNLTPEGIAMLVETMSEPELNLPRRDYEEWLRSGWVKRK